MALGELVKVACPSSPRAHLAEAGAVLSLCGRPLCARAGSLTRYPLCQVCLRIGTEPSSDE